MIFTVVDGGPTGRDTLGRHPAESSTPPDCASASFDQQLELSDAQGAFVVNDAP